MEAQDLPQALRMILDQRRWTVAELARTLGMSRPWVYAVMSEGRSPSMATAARLLGRVGWEIRISPNSDSGDDVKRRKFMTAAASVAFVPSMGTTPYHDPDYVRMLAQRATGIRDETGGASAARWVVRHVKGIEAASVNANRELQTAASWFMRRAAYILRSAGQEDAAGRLASSALVHANKGGDLSQQAAAHAALSISSFRRGNSDVAVIHARRGLQLAEISNENRAWLNAALGVALSRMPQQERPAREAIDNALSVEEIPVIDRADIMEFAGSALHNMAADRNASATLSEAIRLCASRSVFLQAVCTTDQAMISLDKRELSRTAFHMRELSYLAPMTDAYRVDRGIKQMLAGTAKWANVAEIRQARGQLSSVVR